MEQQPPQPNRRRLLMTLLGAAVVAVLVVSAVWATRSTPPTKPVAATSSPATPTRGPSSTSPAATPTRSAGRHDVVAAAAPTQFFYAGKAAPGTKAFTIKATVCGMNYVRPLDPPGEQHHTVCWVQHDFGVAPGTAATGTTYVLGHSWGQDQLEVLNKISSTAMRQVLALRKRHHTTAVSGVPTYQVTALTGDVITLRTARGVLKYTVRNAYAVAKEQAGNVKPLMAEHTPHRVVIITCGELDHVDYDYNIIVQAYLTSAVATRAAV